MMKNTIYTISRPPTDDWVYYIFLDLIESFKDHCEAYYIWSFQPYKLINFLRNQQFSSPVIFIGIKDTLDAWGQEDFNWWHNPCQFTVRVIRDMLRIHSDKKFVLFVSLEHLHLEIDEPNLYIIPWGGDWVNQQDGYTKLTPVLDKNFFSEKPFISLNRNVRNHRIVLLSYLFGNDLNQHGQISYLDDTHKKKLTPFLDFVNWEFGADHDKIRSQILLGYDRLNDSNQLIDDSIDIYGNLRNDNIGNFENQLRKRYQNSFVEIVSETTFVTPSFILSEKTAHAFYGCNFPIILNGCGAVAHLREIGLDVFDDIVDHSYDVIENPFDRIVTAIESNRRLLTDIDYAKQSWQTCRPRFERNVNVMRDIYSWYEARTRQQFAETLELIK